jgi:hypothetical protein
LELYESVLDWKFLLLHLFEFIISCISSIFLSEIPFSNNQMVNTRSRGGQDIPPIVCAHIANQQNQAPPHPSTHQWIWQRSSSLLLRFQLIQNLNATIQNMQAQQNQLPPLAPNPPVDKHKEFMSHRPSTYSHSTDPLDADDWLKTVTKKLEMTQCTDREMVLYAVGRLEGLAAD